MQQSAAPDQQQIMKCSDIQNKLILETTLTIKRLHLREHSIVLPYALKICQLKHTITGKMVFNIGI